MDLVLPCVCTTPQQAGPTFSDDADINRPNVGMPEIQRIFSPLNITAGEKKKVNGLPCTGTLLYCLVALTSHHCLWQEPHKPKFRVSNKNLLLCLCVWVHPSKSPLQLNPWDCLDASLPTCTGKTGLHSSFTESFIHRHLNSHFCWHTPCHDLAHFIESVSQLCYPKTAEAVLEQEILPCY